MNYRYTLQNIEDNNTSNPQCKEWYGYFLTDTDLLSHLKLDHPIWYPEIECHHDITCCKWKSGECPYNHYLTQSFNNENKLIVDTDYVDKVHHAKCGFCTLDDPRNNIRCMIKFCSNNHFRGHARINKKLSYI